MTPSKLLGGLKAVDPETWHDLILWDVNTKLPETSPISMYIIQGCIQQACEKRGWGFMVCNHIADVSAEKDIYDSEIHDYPAEALLAAYVAAVREGKR